jgi:hypothetical protein
VIAPRRVWRAFRRGRASDSLYNEAWDERWLDGTVSDLCSLLGMNTGPKTNLLSDALLFVACATPGATIVTLAAALVAVFFVG